MNVVMDKAEEHGVAATCLAFGVQRSTYYRHRAPLLGPAERRPAPPRTLGPDERRLVLDTLHEPRFIDLAPAEVHATLLEEMRYLCSVRTMHRILAEHAEVRERRNQLRHPEYKKPELLATGPRQLWSWDITKLRGPQKWTYYYLYVILDVFSRYVVGWTLAHCESAALAKKLIAQTCERQRVLPGAITIHADRGPSMTSKSVAFLMAALGVTKSHSRPYISDDNPFSEAQFKTLKYRPDFPERFGCYEDAHGHCADFFQWANVEHHHSGLGMLTPYDVHHGLAAQRAAERHKVLTAAYLAHPDRFPNGPPSLMTLPTEVWINKPGPAPGPGDALETRSDRSPVASAATGAPRDNASIH